jgi:hypothetical protein
VRGARIELQDRNDLAETARRDAGPMDGVHIPLFDTGKHPCEPAQARFKEQVAGAERRHDIDERGRRL